MNISNKRVIFALVSSLHLLQIATLINADLCNTKNCSNVNNPPQIRFPFRIKDLQPQSCGFPGFDVSCNGNGNGNGKTLLELDSKTFVVDDILYDSRQIHLKDPNNCLPKKLISLNLTKTPFHQQEDSFEFRLFNCSIMDGSNRSRVYDPVDCVSSKDYSVVSVEADPDYTYPPPNCTSLATVYAPYGSQLGTLSTIYLTWDYLGCFFNCGSSTTTKGEEESKSKINNGTLAIALVPTLFSFALSIWLGCMFFRWQRGSTTNSENTDSNTTSSSTTTDNSHHPRTTPTLAATGLDQVTIDSYPMVVIGQSGRLIKPDDETCPICLSIYAPKETLKILPECLHRFHVDCISQWLLSNSSCPVCRISPFYHHNNQNFA